MSRSNCQLEILVSIHGEQATGSNAVEASKIFFFFFRANSRLHKLQSLIHLHFICIFPVHNSLHSMNGFYFAESGHFESTHPSSMKTTASCGTTCNLLHNGFGRWVSGRWMPYIQGKFAILNGTLYEHAHANMITNHENKRSSFSYPEAMLLLQWIPDVTILDETIFRRLQRLTFFSLANVRVKCMEQNPDLTIHGMTIFPI